MKTILLADDSRNIRACCREELETEGYGVVLACDGHEAIALTQSAHPDLVVLDVHMPHLGGLDAIETIRQIAPRVPVILFTAQRVDTMADCRVELAAACIAKNEDLAQLKREIARLLHHCPPGPARFKAPAQDRPDSVPTRVAEDSR